MIKQDPITVLAESPDEHGKHEMQHAEMGCFCKDVIIHGTTLRKGYQKAHGRKVGGTDEPHTKIVYDVVVWFAIHGIYSVVTIVEGLK
jgi:hypothetical protein